MSFRANVLKASFTKSKLKNGGRSLIAAGYGFDEIGNNAFDGMPKLKELDLSNNNLKNISIVCASLIQLDLSNNELQDINGVLKISSLKSISCDGNQNLTKGTALMLAFLLPKLEEVNEKNAANLRKQAHSLEAKLLSVFKRLTPNVQIDATQKAKIILLERSVTKEMKKLRLEAEEFDFVCQRVKSHITSFVGTVEDGPQQQQDKSTQKQRSRPTPSPTSSLSNNTPSALRSKQHKLPSSSLTTNCENSKVKNPHNHNRTNQNKDDDGEDDGVDDDDVSEPPPSPRKRSRIRSKEGTIFKTTPTPTKTKTKAKTPTPTKTKTKTTIKTPTPTPTPTPTSTPTSARTARSSRRSMATPTTTPYKTPFTAPSNAPSKTTPTKNRSTLATRSKKRSASDVNDNNNDNEDNDNEDNDNDNDNEDNDNEDNDNDNYNGDNNNSVRESAKELEKEVEGEKVKAATKVSNATQQRTARARAKRGRNVDVEPEVDASLVSKKSRQTTTQKPKQNTHPPATRVLTIALDKQPITDMPVSTANPILSKLLRAHGNQDEGIEDESTPVYACAFAPTLESENVDITSGLVATAGGNCVCFIECEVGRVVKKYTHTGEDFYTLAWTSLHPDSQDTKHTPSLVVAAAGLQGDIKLIDYDQMVCYAQLGGHDNYITDLKFHPTKQDWLASCDAGGVVFIWEIHAYDTHNTDTSGVMGQCDAECMVVTITFGESLSLNTLQLVAGCEQGMIKIWDVDVKATSASWLKANTNVNTNANTSTTAPTTTTTPLTIKPTATTAAATTTTLMTISNEQEISSSLPHKSWLIDCIVHLGDNQFLSRAIEQDFIALWKYEPTLNKANVLLKLRYPKSGLYCLKSSVNQFCDGSCSVWAGTETGQILEYSFQLNNKNKGGAIKSLDPKTVLREVQDGGPVRFCCGSRGLRYSIAAHDKNLISVWTRS